MFSLILPFANIFICPFDREYLLCTTNFLQCPGPSEEDKLSLRQDPEHHVHRAEWSTGSETETAT